MEGVQLWIDNTYSVSYFYNNNFRDKVDLYLDFESAKASMVVFSGSSSGIRSYVVSLADPQAIHKLQEVYKEAK